MRLSSSRDGHALDGGGRGLGSPVLPRRLPGGTGADALGGCGLCLGRATHGCCRGCAVPKSRHRGQTHPWGCSGAVAGWCWSFWSPDIAAEVLCVKGTLGVTMWPPQSSWLWLLDDKRPLGLGWVVEPGFP